MSRGRPDLQVLTGSVAAVGVVIRSRPILGSALHGQDLTTRSDDDPARTARPPRSTRSTRRARQRATPVLQLVSGGQLLGKSGLNAVKEPFEPAHELRLGDSQLRLGRNAVTERQAQPAQF